jgi:probable rRNA maturation factor
LLDVEILHAESTELDIVGITQACELALAVGGISDGHVAIEFVIDEKMQQINRVHRGKDRITDVLSFPIDGDQLSVGPRELGDVVICLSQVNDVLETVIHGALHLVGMDHETDDGEMLAMQSEICSWIVK